MIGILICHLQKSLYTATTVLWSLQINRSYPETGIPLATHEHGKSHQHTDRAEAQHPDLPIIIFSRKRQTEESHLIQHFASKNCSVSKPDEMSEHTDTAEAQKSDLPVVAGYQNQDMLRN